MSTTMEGIDARGYLSGWLQGVTMMYVADIKAIPADKWTATFGGCTRPANELTADAISLLSWCTEALQGNVMQADQDAYIGHMQELSASIASQDLAVAKLIEASEALGSAINAASDETMNTVIMPPWQMPAPLFILAQIAVSHIWYHDGQLNYVHCLLGDNQVHWMPPA